MADTASLFFRDEQTRRLYANDASSYEELPEAVGFPRSLPDIQKIIRLARETGAAVTARGAGTSLAGQATGGGIIMDTGRFMDRIIDIDPGARSAHVQPGVIRDTLIREAAKYDLLFGPDTATNNRCMIGGMIGNNSCGSFSIKHKTTREQILEIEAVLSDGSRAVFRPLKNGELGEKLKLNTLEGHIYRETVALVREHREQILEHYPHPEIIRRNTGYALDKLCTMQPFEEGGRPFNMAELLCGSEGTLAMTASAKLHLDPVDHDKVMLVPHFSSIRKALEATVKAVEMSPAAAELVDHVILGATRQNIEQRRNRFFLDGEPHCILIIQFEGKDPRVLEEKARRLARMLKRLQLAGSVPVITDREKIGRVWELRKAGLGLLMGLGSEGRTPTFCEDTAVRVRDLPEYIEEFREILSRHNTGCVFYAHASVGELHLRPVINLQKPGEIEKMKTMAGEIASLVRKYRGSLSGEHGDGRARAPFIEKVLGPEMMPLLKRVKRIWDPENIFNPGKIVDPEPMEQDLRYSPSYRRPRVDTRFKWRKESSFADAVELCNGAGACRKLAESGGTMCPSYMATKEEKDSTRGRANLFRQLFSGRQQEAFRSEELRDALDLCVSCKACKSECPANVDMARMKAEFMNGWNDEHGIAIGDRFFAEAAKIYPFAAKMPRLSSWMLRQPAVKELLYRLFNIDRRRTLPGFARESFSSWFEKRSQSGGRPPIPLQNRPASQSAERPPTPSPVQPSSGRSSPGKSAAGPPAGGTGSGEQRVILLVDIFTNYHDPEIARAAVRFLEANGCRVIVPRFHELGRPQLSKGMLAEAERIMQERLPVLSGYARQEIPIVGLEPSEILTLRDEYRDLCRNDQLGDVQAISGLTYTFEEFAVKLFTDFGYELDSRQESVFIHNHCHAEALSGDEPVVQALKLAGYDPRLLETGCCGMAGSFGYEADHYEVSMQIGDLVLFPGLKSLPEDALICAPGFSCRHQIRDGAGRKAHHPAELIAGALATV